MPDVIITPASSSIDFYSGSGNILSGEIQLLQNRLNYSSSFHLFTGSVLFSNPVTASTFSGSLIGSSSFATTASYAHVSTTASYVNVSALNSFIQGGNSFGTTAVLGTNDVQRLDLETSGSTRMTITSTGSVGIRTVTPTAVLDVNASGSLTGNNAIVLALQKGSGSVQQYYIYSKNYEGTVAHSIISDANGHVGEALYYNGTGRVYTNTYWGSYINNSNYLSGGLALGSSTSTHYYGLYVANGTVSGSAFFETGTNRNVKIGGSGSNVGASNTFTVRMDDNSAAAIRLQNLDTAATTNHGVGMIANFGNNTSSNVLNAGALYFLKEGAWTSDTTSYDSYFRLDTTENNTTSEKLRVTSAGFVGIGTSNPSNKLHVYQGIAQVDSGTSYGINVGDVQLRSSSTTYDDLILLNLGSSSLDGLRFSNSTSWNYDAWAGLNYFITGTSGVIKLGGPRAFRQNTAGYTGSILLSANGQYDLYISASSVSSSLIGIGTNYPTAKLDVVTTSSGSSVIQARGTNGTLFNVTDDLSDSLLSVNDTSGLPVLEVFADDRIIAGRYNQNDFTINAGNTGLGTSVPTNKLSVYGNTQITGSLGVGCSPSTGSYSGQVHISGSSSSSSVYALKFDRVSMDTVTSGGGYTFKAWLRIYVDNVSGFTSSSTYYIPIYS